MRVLVAEDDPTTLAVLSHLLRKWGYDPVPTQDGAEALATLRQPDPPRLLLLDWNIPKINGLEVTRHVRAMDHPNRPYIILVTCKGETECIVTGLDTGANDYIVKPYQNEELRARVGVGQRMLELQTTLLEVHNELAHQALHDPLTGAHNRRAIDDVLRRELARAKREHVGLAIGMCDIDHFKQVNDRYGHVVGDNVLCGLVHRLKSHLRQYDYLGRWGGEEFLVIGTGITGVNAGPFFERLRAVVADKPMPTRAGNLLVTVSIGVSIWSGKETEDELLSAADNALYQAKRHGRNRVNTSSSNGRAVAAR